MEIKRYKRHALLLLALRSFSQHKGVAASKLSPSMQANICFRHSAETQTVFRGGALSSPSSTSSKKTKKRKSKKAATHQSEPAKSAIANAMGKDSTEALGDAIR